jgi:5-methylcytosine-specific restriction protein B
MNTADRSIALVDYALRRRFAFLGLTPQYGVLSHFHLATTFDPSGLIAVLKDVNQAIGDPHYALGAAFFLRPGLAAELESIWRTEIEPYLEEYFFDRPERWQTFRWEAVQGRILGEGH